MSRSEDDEMILSITEQRSGQPSVIRYVQIRYVRRLSGQADRVRIFQINKEDPSNRQSGTPHCRKLGQLANSM